MINTNIVNCVFCILPTDKISLAVKHKIVEEIRYILSGQSEIWQKS
jgi:hypothetical protein